MSEFENQFQNIMVPELNRLNFIQIKLQRCMSPEYLYKKNDLWFSLSWD